jgi:hypothetical protein
VKSHFPFHATFAIESEHVFWTVDCDVGRPSAAHEIIGDFYATQWIIAVDLWKRNAGGEIFK